MLFAIANIFLISVELRLKQKFSDFFFLKITDAQIYYKSEANLKQETVTAFVKNNHIA